MNFRLGAHKPLKRTERITDEGKKNHFAPGEGRRRGLGHGPEDAEERFCMLDVLKLVGVFFVIVAFIKYRKPLPLAIAAGGAAASILYGLGLLPTLGILYRGAQSWSTLSVLFVFYLITFLQRMLERRGALRMAERSLDGLFNNRKVNASLAPMFIGLLPSAGAVTICGAIVDSACGDHLTTEEKTLATSYFRHIPESFLPTYSSIIVGVELSGVPMSSYLLGMIPMVAVLIALGYFFCLRKLPRETGQPASPDRRKDLANLVRSLWPIALAVTLVIALEMPVYATTLLVIIANALAEKFSPAELKPLFLKAFEPRLLVSTFAVMLFKDIINATGVVGVLPGIFAALPIPTYLVFFLIFFFGTIVSGQMAITAICMPLAFAAMPDGGMPLLVLLLSAGYMAMQISPTHVCLAIVTEYFCTDMGTLIRMTMPIVFAFSGVLLGYYLLLRQVLHP